MKTRNLKLPWRYSTRGAITQGVNNRGHGEIWKKVNSEHESISQLQLAAFVSYLELPARG